MTNHHPTVLNPVYPFLFFFCLILCWPVTKASAAASHQSSTIEHSAQLAAARQEMDAAIQKKSKKLRWQDRLALKVLKHKVKRLQKKAAKEGEQKVQPLALIGLILTVLGVFFWPLVIAGVILCALALSKMKQEPGRWKGKWLAYSGLIIGALWLCLVIYALVEVGMLIGG